MPIFFSSFDHNFTFWWNILDILCSIAHLCSVKYQECHTLFQLITIMHTMNSCSLTSLTFSKDILVNMLRKFMHFNQKKGCKMPFQCKHTNGCCSSDTLKKNPIVLNPHIFIMIWGSYIVSSHFATATEEDTWKVTLIKNT